MSASKQVAATVRGQGRPVATTHAAIEAAAFSLFSLHGFEETTLQQIADKVGVGRRTIFRYFESKNDIPWGQFDLTLARFQRLLEASPDGQALHAAVHAAVVEFNRFPSDADPPHRQRMRLILETPALQAHSVLKYSQWRQVISDFVTARTGEAPGRVLPETVGHVSLALALTAYEGWLRDDDSDLLELLNSAMEALRSYLV
jgi:mycofactocin system transcriptional regulator